MQRSALPRVHLAATYGGEFIPTLHTYSDLRPFVAINTNTSTISTNTSMYACMYVCLYLCLFACPSRAAISSTVRSWREIVVSVLGKLMTRSRMVLLSSSDSFILWVKMSVGEFISKRGEPALEPSYRAASREPAPERLSAPRDELTHTHLHPENERIRR